MIGPTRFFQKFSQAFGSQVNAYALVMPEAWASQKETLKEKSERDYCQRKSPLCIPHLTSIRLRIMLFLPFVGSLGIPGAALS